WLSTPRVRCRQAGELSIFVSVRGSSRECRSREADHETHVQNGDGGGWYINRRVDNLGGYVDDASDSRGARGRSGERDGRGLCQRSEERRVGKECGSEVGRYR